MPASTPTASRARISSPVHDERGSAGVALGWAALLAFLLVMGVVAAALVMSFRVKGHSMEPEMRDGDRIVLDQLHNDDIERFDLVQGVEPGPEKLGGGQQVVKRVVGLPGDRVAIAGGDVPVVYLSPAGTKNVYRVDNPAWSDRTGDRTGACCLERGTYDKSSAEPAWASVPDDSVWVIGDNWGASTDSRAFGYLPLADITGKPWLRILPVDGFGGFRSRSTLVEVSAPVAGLEP